MTERWLASVIVVLLATAVGRTDELPKMKFNEGARSPQVFFRYSSISRHRPEDPLRRRNNIWVVFNDYVVVYDANFPKEAGDVVAAIRKTTEKPIRYVLDSHHHGDHAYGNDVSKEGRASSPRPTAPAAARAVGGVPQGRRGTDRTQGHRREPAAGCRT
jgi:glyoxylase-like metal-dependent hydrolase (beta-lactamase superfamily II)